MNQSQFEQDCQDQWHEFSQILTVLESKQKKSSQKNLELHSFPSRYRRICNQYGLARSRHYSPALVDQLHDLVLQGHRQLYRRKNTLLWQGIRFISRDFPQTIRASSGIFLLALLLFFGPAISFGTATFQNPALIYSLMGDKQVNQMESMYHPDNKKIGRSSKRNGETDFAMFGFYIMNNISIGFRTFAGGIFFGAGAVFFLIYNGLMIGGVAGHLSHPPFASVFWPFVSGHGAYELTAIVICGAAGLLLGHSLIMPGRLKRKDSLRAAAPIALRLVMGAALMLVCAAFIEAFWSPSLVESKIKYWAAGANWFMVILYLCFCGRTPR